MDDEGMQRLVGRPERMVADGHIASTSVFERKFRMEERIGTMVNANIVVSNKWDEQSETHGFNNRGREWISKKSSSLHSKEPSGCESNHYYLEGEKMFDEIYSQDNTKKDDGQNAKLFEDLEGPFVHELAEESEGFKQMVHMVFLSFSKKLNENPFACKLYREQGEAGSLFCIVCGLKSSKEFLDTQRLVGLRADHLDLHRAICVLMGWNSVAAPDVVTWIPQVLPQAEAMAQKEDLILWPPVVIVHIISLSNNNHGEWNVISVEALGAFLSSKSFNQGTYSGLQEAERLHKYFFEKQQGRKEFEQVTSNIDENSSAMQKGTPADEGEESLLYCYRGISEDLDRVDFDSKKRCLVKSRKEIQGLADAPVKPE
ncbi:hypothetical protein Ancab_000125 [Ancistrocladus abbreviatus]